MTLIANWKLGENPAIHGTTLVDTTGNYDMTLNTGDGSTNKSITGKNNNAVDFDGNNDYAKHTSQIVNSPTSLTICGWIKKETDGGSYECALHHATAATIGSSSYWFGVDINNNLCNTIGASTGVGWSAGNTNIQAVYGTWYHLMSIWDGSTVKVYVDNVLKVTYTLTTYNSVDYPTRIGGSADGTNYQFRGAIEDVRIYDNALTDSERTEVFEGSNPATITGASTITGALTITI